MIGPHSIVIVKYSTAAERRRQHWPQQAAALVTVRRLQSAGHSFNMIGIQSRRDRYTTLTTISVHLL